MQVEQYSIDAFKVLDSNPRIIDTFKFQTLVNSIREFPEMMNIRPLVIDENMYILCGNMRYRACRDLGWDFIPAIMVELSEDKKNELLIKDNISYGEWDDDAIEQDWNVDLFNKWMGRETFDYSALDYTDLTGDMDAMSAGVKKAIQIEFGSRIVEAKALEREARIQGIYIGGLFIESLKEL